MCLQTLLFTIYLSGMTPQRREFHYPRILDKTQRHSLLLQDFRKDYDMNMAMETPLPDDSFTSQVSASGPRSYNQIQWRWTFLKLSWRVQYTQDHLTLGHSHILDNSPNCILPYWLRYMENPHKFSRIFYANYPGSTVQKHHANWHRVWSRCGNYIVRFCQFIEINWVEILVVLYRTRNVHFQSQHNLMKYLISVKYCAHIIYGTQVCL